MNNELIKTLLKHPKESGVLLKTDFRRFIKVFHYYLTKSEFIFKPFHHDIINALEDRVFGKNHKNLVINVSPRFGKSLLMQYFIAWTYAINSDCNNIYTSYSEALVLQFSGKIKNIVSSELYGKLFGLKIQTDSKSKAIWGVQGGGETRATSQGGSLTGFGAGVVKNGVYGGSIFIDDPIKVEDARSKVAREKCINLYTDTLKTRRNNKDTPFIVIMQRVHIDDLVGYIEKNEKDDWEFIKVPLWDEKTGALAWEEKFDLEACKKMKERNPYKFYSQYQQVPIISGGNIIKSEWFKRYKEAPDRFKNLYIVCDTAVSTKTTADNSVFGLIGLTDTNDLYILDMWVGKVGFYDLKVNLKSFYLKAVEKYNRFSTVSSIYIENKSSGASLIQELRKYKLPISELMPTYYNKVLQKETTSDKLTRYYEVESDLVNGYVYIPESSNWVLPFLEECEVFDGLGKTHDDRVDVLIYALKVRRKFSVIDWGESLTQFEQLNQW